MTAIEYLKERARLTKNCAIPCEMCRLSSENNGADLGCGGLEQEHPEKAVAIMEQWSKDCPQKTRLQDFKEKYPNAPTYASGIPEACCCSLGYCDISECPGCIISKCADCWNKLLEE